MGHWYRECVDYFEVFSSRSTFLCWTDTCLWRKEIHWNFHISTTWSCTAAAKFDVVLWAVLVQCKTLLVLTSRVGCWPQAEEGLTWIVRGTTGHLVPDYRILEKLKPAYNKKKFGKGSMYCSSKPSWRWHYVIMGEFELKMEYFRSSGFEFLGYAVLVSFHCY